MIALLLIVLTGSLSALLTGRVRAYALRNDVLDRPNERSSHSAPIPRGGGLAVLLSALIALGAGAMLGRIEGRHALALGPGMILLGLVGWRDDHGGLSARVRLAAQILAASCSLAVLGGLPSIQLGSHAVQLGFGGTILAGLGVVWCINLFNFMDGIDGIAGSQALLVFGAAGLLFHARDDVSLATLSFVFAAASAGFLCWNWPPARIFMGDVASGALGFMIAILAVAGEHDRSVPLLAFCILGGVFLGDATLTLLRRLKRGRHPAEAHRDHAYQRLARAWGAHRPVTLLAAAVTAMLAALAALATFRPSSGVGALLAALVLLLALALAIEWKAPMS